MLLIFISSVGFCDSSFFICLLLSSLLLIRVFPQLLFILLSLEFLSLLSLLMLFFSLTINYLSLEFVYIFLSALVLEASIGLSLLVGMARFKTKMIRVMQ